MSGQILPFDTRCKIYSYLDLMTLNNVISKLSIYDREMIIKPKIMDQKRSLLINICNDSSIDFQELIYIIQLCSKIDLRIQKFDQSDTFILGAILHLSKQFDKKIELNVWVDKDLDVKHLMKAYGYQFHDLIDFIYYRFDCKNYSYKFKQMI